MFLINGYMLIISGYMLIILTSKRFTESEYKRINVSRLCLRIFSKKKD